MPWNVIEINPEGEMYIMKTCDTHEEADDVATSLSKENRENYYLVEEVK
jgi:hypothetical protein